jgi:hypothetical protein
VTQEAGFSYLVPGDRWPSLPSAPVAVPGRDGVPVTVTYAQAQSALAALALAGGSSVRQVLRAAGSPLADCDYHAAGAPFRALAAAELDAEEAHPGRGAAGRPEAKRAFMAALAAALAAAEAAEPARAFAADLEQARAAFGSDAGYAAAMAGAAVTVLRREHDKSLRSRLAAGVRQAMAACASRAWPAGQAGCAAVSACGTGDCGLALPHLAGPAVPAGPGRLARPPGHVRAGEGFGTAGALAALAAAVPFTVAVRASSADAATVRDATAA